MNLFGSQNLIFFFFFSLLVKKRNDKKRSLGTLSLLWPLPCIDHFVKNGMYLVNIVSKLIRTQSPKDKNELAN